MASLPLPFRRMLRVATAVATRTSDRRIASELALTLAHLRAAPTHRHPGLVVTYLLELADGLAEASRAESGPLVRRGLFSTAEVNAAAARVDQIADGLRLVSAELVTYGAVIPASEVA